MFYKIIEKGLIINLDHITSIDYSSAEGDPASRSVYISFESRTKALTLSESQFAGLIETIQLYNSTRGTNYVKL